MDILSFLLGYNKGKAQGGGGDGGDSTADVDSALDEVDVYLDAINGEVIGETS